MIRRQQRVGLGGLALPVISQRNPSIANMVVAMLSGGRPRKDVSQNFTRLRCDWIGKGSGGSQVGQTSSEERDQQRKLRVNQGNANTGGNIGVFEWYFF